MAQAIRFEPGLDLGVVNPPQFDAVASCIRRSTYSSPVPLKLLVTHPDNEDETVTLLVAPTCLRIVLAEDTEEAEYVFEGWIVRPAYAEPPRVWVQCHLRKTVSTDRISEAVLEVLPPGTELGVAPPPGFD